MTVFGHERHAELNGLGGRDVRTRLTVDLDGAGVDGAKTEDGLQNLGATAADQSRESVDFAAAKHEVDVMQAVVADVR